MPKQYTNARILTDGQGKPIPQYLDTTDTTDSPQGTFKPLTELQYRNQPKIGYSTDAKPSQAREGDAFYEIDTDRTFLYDGNEWVEV